MAHLHETVDKERNESHYDAIHAEMFLFEPLSSCFLWSVSSVQKEEKWGENNNSMRRGVLLLCCLLTVLTSVAFQARVWAHTTVVYVLPYTPYLLSIPTRVDGYVKSEKEKLFSLSIYIERVMSHRPPFWCHDGKQMATFCRSLSLQCTYSLCNCPGMRPKKLPGSSSNSIVFRTTCYSIK